MRLTERRVVYTALIGVYEELLPQPLAQSSGVDFVCFTDDPELRSADWSVHLVSPAFHADAIRSSRAVKIAPEGLLAHYDSSLWIDNRVLLTEDPELVMDEWLSEHDVAAPRHSYRTDVIAEFQAVLDAGLDEAARLYEQLTHYAALDPGHLSAPVPWTGMLARRHTAPVREAMRTWNRHVMRYSRRDQLSFVHTMHEAGLTWHTPDVATRSSRVHEWRDPEGRSPVRQAFQVAASLQPPIAQLGQLRLDLERSVHDASMAAQRREDDLASAQAQVDALRVQVEAASAELDDARQALEASAQQRTLDQERIRAQRTRIRRARAARRAAEDRASVRRWPFGRRGRS